MTDLCEVIAAIDRAAATDEALAEGYQSALRNGSPLLAVEHLANDRHRSDPARTGSQAASRTHGSILGGVIGRQGGYDSRYSCQAWG